MVRWLVLLGAGLYAAMLVGGADDGRMRAGLQGAYAIAAFTAPPAPAPQADAPPAPAPMAAVALAPMPLRQPAPAQSAVQPAAPDQSAVFSLATATAADGTAAPAEPPAAPPAEWRRVTGTALNVRQGPSAQDAVVGRLLRDEVVLLIDTRGGWSRIRIEGDGIEGWVANRYLTAAATD